MSGACMARRMITISMQAIIRMTMMTTIIITIRRRPALITTKEGATLIPTSTLCLLHAGPTALRLPPVAHGRAGGKGQGTGADMEVVGQSTGVTWMPGPGQEGDSMR